MQTPEKLEFHPATREALHEVLSNLPAEHATELGLLGFPDPVTLVNILMTVRGHVEVITYGGRLVAIAGITSDDLTCTIGRPYLLPIEGAKVPPRMYLREASQFLERVGSKYTILSNTKWGGNAHHMRWLQALGFFVLNSYNTRGHRFHHIVKETG